MTNEAVALIILFLWLAGGRALNLCLLIFLYYISYMALDSLFYGHVSNQTYSFVQTILDSIVISLACLLSFRDKGFNLVCIVYALFVLSSLTMDLLMVFDEVYQTKVIYKYHEYRQLLSHPLELVFALLGSGIIERLRLRALSFVCWSSYNKRNSDKDINSSE